MSDQVSPLTVSYQGSVCKTTTLLLDTSLSLRSPFLRRYRRRLAKGFQSFLQLLVYDMGIDLGGG